MLSDFLIDLGCGSDRIFYTSNPVNGVRDRISDEVLDALKSSTLDIILLSNEYKNSAYCLNEAGIIWYKGSATTKIIILLHDVLGQPSAGFLNEDYIQYRMSDEHFLDNLMDRVMECLGIKLSGWNEIKEIREEFRQKFTDYKNALPLVKSLTHYAGEKGLSEEKQVRIKEAREKARNALHNRFGSDQAAPDMFYEYFNRNVILKGTKDGMVLVETATDYVFVNLSNNEHTKKFSAQFVAKKGGGYDSFASEVRTRGAVIEENGRPVEAGSSRVYRYSAPITLKTPPHTAVSVQHTSTYEITTNLFFQSGVMDLPCGSYTVRAHFDDSFYENIGGNYIFQQQVIPPNPHYAGDCLIPERHNTETPDKKTISLSYTNGFPASSGYVITIAKVNE